MIRILKSVRNDLSDSGTRKGWDGWDVIVTQPLVDGCLFENKDKGKCCVYDYKHWTNAVKAVSEPFTNWDILRLNA